MNEIRPTKEQWDAAKKELERQTRINPDYSKEVWLKPKTAEDIMNDLHQALGVIFDSNAFRYRDKYGNLIEVEGPSAQEYREREQRTNT